MPRIVVCGAAVFDITFAVPHWPQPNRSVHATHVGLSPGGKGLNTAVAAGRLGGDVAFVGCTGRDFIGDYLHDTLAQEHIDTQSIVRHPTARTSVVGMIVHEAVPGFIGAPDASKQLTPSDIERAFEPLQSGDVVLINFEIPHPIIEAALRQAKAKGAHTVLNPAPYFTTDSHVATYLSLVDTLIPNLHEAVLLTGDDSGNAPTLARTLLNNGVGAVCITQGDSGCTYVDQATTVSQAAISVEVVDTSGASDAFCAGYLVGLVEGLAIEQRLRFASAAAALACTAHGTMPAMPYRDAVDLLRS